jgi:hypothetical protein
VNKLLITFVGLALVAATGFTQTATPSARGKAATGAPTAVAQPAPDPLLAGVKLVKGSNGTWKCQGDRTPCTEKQVQALTGHITKSRSNVKNNLVVVANPDLTISCKDTATNSACTDAAFQSSVGVAGIKVILGPQTSK